MREDVQTGDADALAWSLNEHRRHAGEGVRALAAARRANMRQGERTDLASNEARSQSDAAEQFGVSRSAVQRARTVLDAGSPALVAAVESGDVAVSLAAKAVRQCNAAADLASALSPAKPR